MINANELQAALKEIQGERAISFASLLEALEAALISAYKRNFSGDAHVIVEIDRDTGEYKVYHRRVVVEDDAVVDAKTEVARSEARSEEHTSELQSRQYLVCRLLLEKK